MSLTGRLTLTKARGGRCFFFGGGCCSYTLDPRKDGSSQDNKKDIKRGESRREESSQQTLGEKDGAPDREEKEPGPSEVTRHQEALDGNWDSLYKKTVPERKPLLPQMETPRRRDRSY